jgi:glycosyltransferase involved in cell wall biosynthesis
MKVLFLSRSTLYSVPGGDTVQMLKTADGLRARGCDVTVSVDIDPNMHGFDLVHVFNLTRPQETYFQSLAASKRGIPIVFSPIYVDYREYDQHARRGVSGRILRYVSPEVAQSLKILGRMIVSGEQPDASIRLLATGYRYAQERLLAMSAILLPNSHSEMLRLKRDFPSAAGKRYSVVPNAVDVNVFSPNKSDALEEFKDCVLCVGRIEGRKCQLELVRAVNDTPLKLVLIGKPAPNALGYFRQIQKEMGPNVALLGDIAHEELPKYYSSCKVHALVSWMETTGLSSLEAGAMGCNLVITDKGDTREYFGDLAFYCSPDSIQSIRAAILAAHRAQRSERLREKIISRYSWDHTSEATLSAYHNVLENLT